MNVPDASSVRSRMEANPTRPIRRNSLARSGSNPRPLSTTSTRSCPASASTETFTSLAAACFAAFVRASCTTR